MNCGTCKHWNLVGEMGRHGYGQCFGRVEQHRNVFTTSAQNVCRIGKFAKADIKVIVRREKEQGVIL